MDLPTLTGVAGIQTGFEHLRRDAHEIASAVAKGGENTGDLAKSLVDLNTDRREIAASVKVVQAIDETIGTLLDVLA